MKKTIHRYVFSIGKWTFVCGRWIFYSGLLVSIFFVVLFISVKVWLPEIAEKKSEIESFLSEQTGLDISTDGIKPYWNGIYPGLIIKNVKLVDPKKKKKELKFSEIRASLAILPFLRGSVEFSEVVILKKKIVIEKQKSGKILFNNWPVPEAIDNGSDYGFLEWLGRLHHVKIITSEFIWNDRTSGGKPFLISNLELQLDNNDSRHKLVVNGDFPADFCRSCTVTANFTSEALRLAELTGSMELDAIDLDLANLPMSVKKLLPKELAGRFQTQIYSEFSNGSLLSLKGHVIADELVLPLPSTKIVNINTMSGHVDWNLNKDDWRLLITDLNLGLTSEEWHAGKLRVEKIGNKKLVYLERAKLNDLSEFISRIDTNVKEVEFIKKLKLGGEVRNLRLEFENNFSSLADTSVVAELIDVEVSQVADNPSARGISGTISIKGNEGEFRFNSKNSKIIVPKIFRAPIETEYLSGIVSWHKRKDAWEINMLDLKIIAKDVKAESNFQILLHDDATRLPTVKVRVDFKEGRGYRTPLFYPKNLASPELLAWLDRALQSGYVNKGYAILEGPLDNFPFKDGSGKFDVMVDISGATLDYLTGWAPLEDAEAVLKFNGGEMVITVKSGNINGLDVRGATAYASDLTTDEGRVIHISGTANGPIESAINILRKTPQGSKNGPWEQWLNPGLHTDGNGKLDIQVSFTPGANEDPVINGTYQTEKGIVMLPWKGIQVERIHGTVGFDGQGITHGRVEGILFGGPVKLDISRQDLSDNVQQKKIPLVQINASGRVESKELIRTFADWMQPYVSGQSNWQARLAWDDKIYFNMKSDLTNTSIKLPVPFKKPGNLKSGLSFSTVSTSRNNLLLAYDLYDTSNGKLLFHKQKGKWDFYGAQIGVFDAISETPEKPGVQIHVTRKNFDADEWAGVIKSYLGSKDKGPSYIDSIQTRFDNVDLFNRHFGEMDINLSRKDKSLSGFVDGASITGKIKFNSDDDSPELDFDLSRLYIPKDTFRDSNDRTNPRGFPSMEIRAGEFRFGNAVFGETILKGVRESLGYRVTRFVVNSKHYNMIGRGRWYRIGNLDDAEVKLSFTSSDLGKALTSMGSPDQVAEGEGSLTANLKWPKTQGISFANMDGNVQMSFKRGRFLQIEQGAGRLLGLLDMSSIMRYLRLDLSSIFSTGFLFDSMKAKFNIENGNAHTNKLSIKGPSADMFITGNIGLDKQDFDMVVGVNPSLTDTLALAVGGLLAPQVGAAILILKNVFNTDVVPSPSINYSIKGTWDKPVVGKLTGDEGTSAPELLDDDSTN